MASVAGVTEAKQVNEPGARNREVEKGEKDGRVSLGGEKNQVDSSILVRFGCWSWVLLAVDDGKWEMVAMIVDSLKA